MRARAALLALLLAAPAAAQEGEIELFVLDPEDDPFRTGERAAAPGAGAGAAADLPPVVACLTDPASAACAGGGGDLQLEVHIVLPDGGAADVPDAGADAGAAAYAAPPVYSVDVAIQFDFDSDAIRATEWPKLDTLAEALRHEALSATPFVLVGHTDAKGSDAYNCDLSARRARSVEAAMRARGVGAYQLAALGAGESTLIQGLPPVDPGHRRVGLVKQAEAAPLVERARLFCDY